MQPDDSRYKYDTIGAEVFDVIIFPHMEFCRDKKVIVDEKHNWLPAPGGHLLVKYRRAVVFERFQGGLKVGTFTTFSNTPMEDKRKQKVFDEVQNEMVLSLGYYVHIVAVDNPDESQKYPECSMKGLPVRYRAAPGCHAGKVKDSFMNPYTPCIMTNGTPFRIVGEVEHRESTERLKTAVQATFVRTLSNMTSAMEAKDDQGRKEKARIEAWQATELERFHAKQQDSAFKAEFYDDNSASPLSVPQPPLKRLKPNSAGYIDNDAPDVDSQMDPEDYTPSNDTNTADTKSSKSKLPHTAFRGLNVNTNTNADGRSTMSYKGVGTPKSIPKF